MVGTVAPSAAAAPPGYSGYHAVDPKPFQTYSTYGGAGVQFTSPSGLLCRIVVISRGEFAYAQCFGALAGVGRADLASINTGGAAGFSTSSRSSFLTAQNVGDNGVTTEPISASGFPALRAGSSLTYTDDIWSGTCAVDAARTRCTVTAVTSSGTTVKSFTLGPTASTTS
ncbi:hypothetical protein GCM10023147_06190 [Tsukamurella soli]|uniref:Neocarzinostatin family protein n=1 Tax=Tsukamurella soli TaxID=644556 RepID=A0ABP8J4P1_9ACTN